ERGDRYESEVGPFLSLASFTVGSHRRRDIAWAGLEDALSSADPYPSVVTVAAIATFPSGAIACGSWTPPSVCRPTRWICSLANSGDFAANRYPVTVASAWEDMNASNSRVAVNGPWVTSPGYPSTSVT